METEIIKNLIVEARNNAHDKNYFSFNFGKYSIYIHKDCSMWQVTISDTERLIQVPNDNSVSAFLKGKKQPTYVLIDRAFNLDYRYNTLRWGNDVIGKGAIIIEDAIEEYEKRLAAGHYEECLAIVNKITSEAADFAEEYLFEREIPAETSIEELTIILDGIMESSDEYILDRMGISEDIQDILFEHYSNLVDKSIEAGFSIGANRFKNAA